MLRTFISLRLMLVFVLGVLTAGRPAAAQTVQMVYRADMATPILETGAGLVLEAQVLEAGRPVALGMDAGHDGRCLSPAGASLPAHKTASIRYATVAFRCDVLVEGSWTLSFQVDVGGSTQTLSAPFVAARPRSEGSSSGRLAGQTGSAQPFEQR